MVKSSLQIQNEINQSQLRTHLAFIDSFGKWCRQQSWRLVLYGGYGLDGYLRTITRNHGDIDLVIYGQTTRTLALASIANYLHKAISEVEIKSKDEEFLIDIKVKSKIISGNLYYVQTGEDPFNTLSIVIKTDGSKVTNSPTDFPPPVSGQLGDLAVEVQDQSAHLADILRKRSSDISHSKHDQDIVNIQTILTK
jgi:hypothetical protein